MPILLVIENINLFEYILLFIFVLPFSIGFARPNKPNMVNAPEVLYKVSVQG